MVSVLTLVFAFQSSAALAFAYGMAVTGTITITTLLFFYIVRHQWRKPLWLVAIGAGFLLTVDLLFLAANLTKITHGAWLPLLIGVTVFTVLTTWQRGRRARHGAARARRGLAARVHRRAARPRAAGAASPGHRGLPQSHDGNRAARDARRRRAPSRPARARRDPLDRDARPVPHVAAAERLVIDDLGYTDDGITHVSARFGYMDEPNVPRCCA